ncbi:MAG: hypothetical protein CM15mP49_17720 [Actinomycetota bacterium]|nr:MAG: hypothetical protein CM15mP49_17720 [Actinomycetota bacterium]
MSEPKQIEIDINPQLLEGMLLRLENTKWPPTIGEDSWDYGVPKQWMQDMVNYWTTEWKWENVAAQINEWKHFSVTIDQVPIHYLTHQVKDRTQSLSLNPRVAVDILGFQRCDGPLSDPEKYGGDPMDSFDVFVPSLPGFIFSSPLTKAGVDVREIAKLWNTLMTEVLGTRNFVLMEEIGELW